MLRPEFEDAIDAAKPGQHVIYHLGNLLKDRALGLHFQAVDNTARTAWGLMEKGIVHLAQQRLRPGVVAYMAIKSPPPHTPVEWIGCYWTPPKAVKAPRLVTKAPELAMGYGKVTAAVTAAVAPC